MYKYANGKYRNLHAATVTELEQLQEQVLAHPESYPSYHLAPTFGLLNDPNGLVFDGEKVHVFYQWHPFGPTHGMKHWRHYVTADFITFEEKDPLIPDAEFDSHGCYSGGAEMYKDQVVVFYTGNTRTKEDNKRVPYINVAIFNKDGSFVKKFPIFKGSTEFYTEHFRDPKPFYFNKELYLVVGAQSATAEKAKGRAVIFKVPSVEEGVQAQYLGELEIVEVSGAVLEAENSEFMWECPDLSCIDKQEFLRHSPDSAETAPSENPQTTWVFTYSPQGRNVRPFSQQNIYHALSLAGRLELVDDSVTDKPKTAFRFTAFSELELDHGHDFYAPQLVNGSLVRVSNDVSAEERFGRLYLAWVGLPETYYPTDTFGWHSMLTQPRILSVDANNLVCSDSFYYFKGFASSLAPVELIGEEIKLADSSDYLLQPADGQGLECSLIELFNCDSEAGSYKQVNFSFSSGLGVIIGYDHDRQVLSLRRNHYQTESMEPYDTPRLVFLPHGLYSLEVFFDRSVVEVFVNRDEKVLTSRFFTADMNGEVKLDGIYFNGGLFASGIRVVRIPNDLVTFKHLQLESYINPNAKDPE